MHVSELDTPALLIDLDIFERNLCRVADYAKANDLRLRPHTKTHKVPAVGKLQIESGAVGLTVAKVGEAEVMLGSGTPDLLVHYHANINHRFEVNEAEANCSYNCQPRTIDYEQGTLVIDVLNARSSKLVWRGWAQDSVQGIIDNQDSFTVTDRK